MTAQELIERPLDTVQPEQDAGVLDPTSYHGALLIARQRDLHQRLARAHTIVARLLLGGLALQIFFAGIAIFGVYTFLPHQILGPIVIGSSIALPILAHKGHLGRSIITRSWVLVGLMMVQGLLIDASRLILPVFGAFHPLNAMLLVLVTYSLARPNHDVI